jgi:WD40 repeat protein
VPAKPTALPDLKIRKRITAAALAKEIPLPESTWVNTATLAPDGRSLLLGSSAAIVVVDLEAGTHRRVEVKAAQYDSVSKVRFTPDGKRIVATCWNGFVAVLAWPSLKQIAAYSIAKDRLHACAVMPDGESAWVGGHDCKRTRVELETGDVLATQTGEWGWISDAAVTPDGSTLVTSDAATVLRFCDGAKGRERKQLKLGIAHNIIVGEREALVPNLYLALVDVATGQVTKKLEGEHKLGAMAAVHADEMIISVGQHDPLMVVWDRESGRPLLTMKPLKKLAFASIVVVGDQVVSVPLSELPIQVWRTAALVEAARAQR